MSWQAHVKETQKAYKEAGKPITYSQALVIAKDTYRPHGEIRQDPPRERAEPPQRERADHPPRERADPPVRRRRAAANNLPPPRKGRRDPPVSDEDDESPPRPRAGAAGAPRQAVTFCPHCGERIAMR